ncbi:hypothetical protein [Pelagicoccus sp. SDUM812005]|uniref:hypothetical protein n=1 Tax=Pelagicoccus sp. SDUM812005 TaxID=3041257 RepID=UPI00280E58BE|nr:hypothetical protein [Pelagicoccus sp. SDUM812005]MDQ8182794.1 hypothetical protein [Pelagicoccus sp. SDUM812005]
MPRSVCWLGGWAVPAESLRAFAQWSWPEVSHRIVLPRAGWEAELEAEDCDALVAYSLGAQLWFSCPDLWGRFERVVLLAPFCDFRREAGLGGKVGQAQLLYLRRWLQRDALGAVRDFYARADLQMEEMDALPYGEEDLLWGVERLLEGNGTLGAAPWESWEARVGGEDRLLDVEGISKWCRRLEVVPGRGHDWRDLMEGLRW